ncbi:MAG: sulfur carrier protein ThiS [bacterium]
MKVIINGKVEEIEEGLSISGLVKKYRPESAGVVVELNETIARRERWPDTTIKENDVIELISFVGGG